MRLHSISLLALGIALTGCSPAEHKPKAQNLDIWPKLDIKVKKDAKIEARVNAHLQRMTLEQKIAQLIQPEIRDITVEDMRQYGFGSYLNGGGSFPNGNKYATPADWLNFAEAMYQASVDDSIDGSTIPTMWGTDAVHGHNNVIGATLFPHNIGLGAANNPELIKQIAQVTAKEVLATGIEWIFAPTVAAVRDDRWGRTYEGYSEDPDIIARYAEAIVEGLQGSADENFMKDGTVISTVKHFLGDGGTVNGDDQGDNIDSEQALFDIHAQGYVTGLEAGAQTVMASFNSWHGEKIHGSKYLLTNVLKERMGFDGFVVGDWSGHGQIEGCSNESCPQAINAGLDMFMAPTKAWKALYHNTLAQAQSGDIPLARIDDAVKRILRVKLRAGLFDRPGPRTRLYSGDLTLIGAKAHREIAAQAVRESLVLLKNTDQILPLPPKQHILVAGNGADDIGKQSGGWTITWQGTGNKNQDFPGATSIYDGIKEKVTAAGGTAILSEDGSYHQKPDVAIVVFGEDPYAEGHGDRENLEYQRGDKSDLALLQRLQSQGIPVVSLFLSGRPMWVNPELNASNAFIAAWLPGSEGAAISDVIFRQPNGDISHPITGKLSFSWPDSPYQTHINRHDTHDTPLLPYGFGLQYGDEEKLTQTLNETIERPTSSHASRQLYYAKMHKPWLMWLRSGDEQVQVTTGAQSLPGLHYRTIDKSVQEDALQLQFLGTHKVGVQLISKSSFREDLRADVESNSAITFSLNAFEAMSGPLILEMRCDGENQCVAAIDITPKLKTLPLNQWHQISIDLQCFKQQGMQFNHTVMPFSLVSEGKGRIGLADISIEPNSAKSATMNCQ